MPIKKHKFYDAAGGTSEGAVISSGVVLAADVITQTLSEGDNLINHKLGFLVHSFDVKKDGLFLEVTGNDIDTMNFNINLAGGADIVDAKIQINYK